MFLCGSVGPRGRLSCIVCVCVVSLQKYEMEQVWGPELGVCCLWTKMEQQFPKLGDRAQKSFQNWTYLLAEREEVFSLFYMLGSQIISKMGQNWGSKLLLQPQLQIPWR